jgi:hypothetical protein
MHHGADGSAAGSAQSSGEPMIRGPRERSGPASDDQPAAAMTSTPRARVHRPEQADSQPSDRGVRAVLSVSVHRPQLPAEHGLLRSNHQAPAPQRARERPRPNRPRVRAHLHRAPDVPHAAPGSVCCVALRATSRVQALAHVMRLVHCDRVINPCETRSFEIDPGDGGVAPRDAGSSGMRTHVRGRYERRRT